MPKPETVTLARSHEIPRRSPIQVEAGDVVRVGRTDSTWPAFVFVTTDQGEGWIPARHLHVNGDVGVAVEAYDTTELAASAGETLEVLRRDDESGWLWCRDRSGQEGWVPVSALMAG